MVRDKDVGRALLEGNGLSERESLDRERIAQAVAQDVKRVRRLETIAIRAWIGHGVLFAINFVIHWNSAVTSNVLNAIPVVYYRNSPDFRGLHSTNQMLTFTDLIIACLFVLNGFFFLVAIIATSAWFFRSRAAAVREFDMRLSGIELELRRMKSRED